MEILEAEWAEVDDGVGCEETVKERQMVLRCLVLIFHHRMDSSSIVWDRSPRRRFVKSSVFGMWNWRCPWGIHLKCSEFSACKWLTCVSHLCIGAASEPPVWLWIALGIAYRVRRDKGLGPGFKGCLLMNRVKENEPGKYR